MTEEKTYFEISESENLIRIELVELNHPTAELDWDRNWISGLVTVKAGVFHGQFKANFMKVDFTNFKDELITLYDKLNGYATFQPLEDQVSINIVGDGVGHLNAQCIVMDEVGHGNKLEFEIDFDQTYIPKILHQLEKIILLFPKT